MNQTDAGNIKEDVHKIHFDTIKMVTKSFADDTDPDFKACVEYVPFLCWATQFHVMTGYAREERKQSDQIKELKTEITEGAQRGTSIGIILDNFKQENLQQFLIDEVTSDKERLILFEQLKNKIITSGRYSQDHYDHFENFYFEQMQKQLIMEKTKLAIKHQVYQKRSFF